MAYIGNQPTTVAFLTDQFSGTGSQTAFTLSAAPANTNSILVSVSGVLQDPTTYSVSGTTLTFSAAPPSGTGNISVRFLGIPASGVTTTAYRTQTDFTATAGQTTFTPPSYTVGYIDVYRNGAKLGAADFTATNGTTVVLASAASSGDLIQTVSFYVSSVLNAIPATNGAVTSAYLLDGSVTQAKLGTGVAGNGPAFSAYASSAVSVTTGVWTKAQINTERFDTNSNYDTTNYRFTPTVAGYYQVNGDIYMYPTSGVASVAAISIYKNGAGLNQNYSRFTTYGWNEITMNTSSVVYLNGSTDYIELYGMMQAGANCNFYGYAGVYTNFSAALIRSA